MRKKAFFHITGFRYISPEHVFCSTPTKLKTSGNQEVPAINNLLNIISRDFAGGPVVKTQPSDAGGMGSIPGQGNKIPTYLTAEKPEYKQQKKCGNKFNKD